MRTLDLIELVVARPSGLAASDISAALDIPMSSLSYLLTTLCEREYLMREGRLYRPGRGLERLRLPESALTLAEWLAPVVRTVRAELNETVSAMVREGWEAVVVATEASDHALRYAIEPGEHRPLHTLAAGKALLAALSPAELDAYFAEAERARFTDHTVADEVALRAQLDAVRKSGFAEAREESTPGICSIGALIDAGGVAVGIGIAVPTVRFSPELIARARVVLSGLARPA